MDKIIYSRISENRDPKFLLKTLIIENGGEKRVIKSPVFPEARDHCFNQVNYANDLKRIYKGTRIKVTDCKELKDGVQFSFIEGDSLENVLNKLLNKNDIPSFVKIIQDYFDALAPKTKEFFIPSEQCRLLFGELDYPKHMEGIVYGNVDSIFSNIMYNSNDELYTMFDYEWTLDFCVPLKYLFFRALFWYQNEKRVQDLLGGLNIFKLFNFSDRELELYLHMEENFQTYVRGNTIPLWKINQRLNTVDYPLLNCLSYYKENCKTSQIHVYYDLGQGYQEQQSFTLPIEEINNLVTVNFIIDSSWQKIRIDPCNQSCVISNLKIWIKKDHFIDIKYTANGVIWDNDFITFYTTNPYLECILPNLGEESFHIEFTLDILHENLLKNLDNVNQKLCNLLACNESSNVENERLLCINKEKENHITNLMSEMNAMKNSRLLKLSRKIKKILPIH